MSASNFHDGSPAASSAKEYPFYELELNLRPTLHESIREYVRKEELKGDDQYLCEHCVAKRDATRDRGEDVEEDAPAPKRTRIDFADPAEDEAEVDPNDDPALHAGL